MNIEIYYFSGTGNSLAVARDLAAKMNARLIPIATVMDQESIMTDADRIGIVFPLYDFKPPLIVDKFVEKLTCRTAKYLFAVGTYGIAPLKAMKYFAKVLKSHGGNPAAGFAVQMPHNGIGSSLFSQFQYEVMFKNWEVKCEEIVEYVTAGKKGRVETSNIFTSLIFSGLLVKIIPLLLKLLKQVILKGWKSLALIACENCDGCGICYRVCPVNNIKIVDNKPVWSGHCAVCLACFHWCPKQAVKMGDTNMNIKQYHHPQVELSDMLRQVK